MIYTAFSTLKYYVMLLLLTSSVFSCSDDTEIETPQEISAPFLNIIEAYTNQIDIDWADVPDALTYEIDVALDKEFNQVLSEYNAIRKEKSQLLIKNLTRSTTYFMRGRAVFSGSKKSKYSNVLEATTLKYMVCENSTDYEFIEKDGIIKVEFEDAEFGDGWELITGNVGSSGQGFMVWNLNDNFSKPSDDLVTYNIKISTPGTYIILWYSAVTVGISGTEHNDTWMRFHDADDFYAKKDTAIVYPKGTGKTPNPEGASADGWFKIYRSGNDLDFKWQARTSDRDPHEIYVVFGEAKTYTMEISARSNGHGIDKFVLYLESINQTTVTESAEFSEINCL